MNQKDEFMARASRLVVNQWREQNRTILSAKAGGAAMPDRHPQTPDDPRFRTCELRDLAKLDSVKLLSSWNLRLLGDGPIAWFLCGNKTWRAVDLLKAYDTEHGTHFAQDCANAARAAWLDKGTELSNAWWEDEYEDESLSTAAEAAIFTAAAWAAWGREEG